MPDHILMCFRDVRGPPAADLCFRLSDLRRRVWSGNQQLRQGGPVRRELCLLTLLQFELPVWRLGRLWRDLPGGLPR